MKTYKRERKLHLMGGGGGECGRRTPYTLPQDPPLRCSDYFMTSVLSFPRYAITYVGCHVRQTGLQNLYTPYLYIGHMQVNTLRPCLRQVHLALAQSDEPLQLIICRRSDSGEAGRSVIGGSTWPSVTFHP